MKYEIKVRNKTLIRQNVLGKNIEPKNAKTYTCNGESEFREFISNIRKLNTLTYTVRLINRQTINNVNIVETKEVVEVKEVEPLVDKTNIMDVSSLEKLGAKKLKEIFKDKIKNIDSMTKKEILENLKTGVN